MSDELRKVDRVMLETLEALCVRMIKAEYAPAAIVWQERRDTMRDLLTEQPEPVDKDGAEWVCQHGLDIVYCSECNPVEQPEPDAPKEVEHTSASVLAVSSGKTVGDLWAERGQYKEKLDTLVGLVETADKNTGSAVAAFNRITLRYKDWNKLRSYAEDAGGTK